MIFSGDAESVASVEAPNKADDDDDADNGVATNGGGDDNNDCIG